MKINYKKLALFIVVTFVVGNLFTLFLMNNMKDYRGYIQPPLSPPGIVFPIVWSILFILMGISIYIISEAKSYDKEKSYLLYFIQLFVNAFWTLFFFGFKLTLFSFFWILFLIILVTFMIIEFYKINKKAAYLQIPYLLWLIFASYLNLGIYLLN